MKKINFLLAMALVALVLLQTANAQVTVTGSTGANATYARLALAFTAINGTAQTGNNIVITITASTNESALAVLNAGAWTTLKIYPTITGLTITGNLPSPLIDLNGADNVTIDGRVNSTGATKDLIITNTNTSATANTSTIRFYNDASTNTVKYCTLKGSTTHTAGGVLFFSSGTTMGNNNNTIDNNNIITCRKALTNFPSKQHNLTNSNIDRQNILNNHFALSQIQEYIGLPGMIFEGEYSFTKEMVANFFEIDISTIDRYLTKYEEELKHNGYILTKGKQLKDLKLQFDHLIDKASKTRQLGLFNFRALLNLSMYLSKVKKPGI